MQPQSRKARVRASLGWVALALLGLVVAAAISLAASQLSSQHIGLSAEPLTEGQSLAPVEDNGGTKSPGGSSAHHPSGGHKSKHGSQSNPSTSTTPAPAAPPVIPIQPATPPAPSSGSGSGRDDSGADDSGGHGHGGDD